MSDNTNTFDLSAFEEPIVHDPDAAQFDPNATASGPPPVPESKEGYVVRLKFAADDPLKQWNKKVETIDGQEVPKWLYTSLMGEILQGPAEGRKIRDGYVSTMVSKQDNTTAVNRICQAAGHGVTPEEVAKYGSHKAQAVKLIEVIGAEGVTLKAFVQWQAKFLYENDQGKKVALKDDAGKDVVIRGASKSDWPKDEKGNPRTSFRLSDVVKDAPPEVADLQATVDAVVTRYVPVVAAGKS